MNSPGLHRGDIICSGQGKLPEDFLNCVKISMHMKLNSALFLLLLCSQVITAQKPTGYREGISGENNLQNALLMSPYASAKGFDNRYQGIKGTPRFFDTLVTSSVLIKGEEQYFRIESDLDVVKNALIFMSPAREMLMEVPSDNFLWVVFHKDGKDLFFRTTEGLKFDQELKGNKFCQVLTDAPYQFIRIPDRKFIDADYQRLYSPDLRYDEYEPVSKYFIQGSDSVFYRVQLTRKSLKKTFPDKKDLIDRNFDEKSSSDPEADVITLLGKF